MSDVNRKLLEDVMALPTQERARLAAALIASLDDEDDRDTASAWADEIERRAERVLAGESRARPWSEVRAHLVARLRRD